MRIPMITEIKKDFSVNSLCKNKVKINLLKFLELVIPIPYLWDILPSSSSGTSSQGGTYGIDTGY